MTFRDCGERIAIAIYDGRVSAVLPGEWGSEVWIINHNVEPERLDPLPRLSGCISRAPMDVNVFPVPC